MSDEGHAGPAAEAGTASPLTEVGATDEAPSPATWADYRSATVLLGVFVVNILLAVLFARPFTAAGLQAFEDPQDVGNSLWYFALILVFTALILWIAKRGLKWIVQAIILGAVGITMAYVFFPLLAVTLGVPVVPSLAVALLAAAGATFWLWKKPEWYVVDLVGVLVAAGAAAIFGISLGILPVLVLLTGLAIYDAVAVYKTRHMLSLADVVIERRLPVLLVIPKHRGYSFLREASKFKEAGPENKEQREALFMGLGDLVMPTILVVSALSFALEGWGLLPAVGAAVGTLVGYTVLMGFVLKGNPQAGLPLLNGGSILGFFVGLLAATGSLVFW